MTKGSSDKRPPKAVAPRRSGPCSPGKYLMLGPLKWHKFVLFLLLFSRTKKHPFQKIYLLAELVHFFFTTRLLYVFTFSLEGSTEPPEPPLDPPQTLNEIQSGCEPLNSDNDV